MCIALFTTAHPDYALICIDNRDEYILRPTSRPHWWTHPISGDQVLSSRDLHRAEQGTWIGVNKKGDFAVLTNYRDSAADDADQNICGIKSRGGMVTSWVGGGAENGVAEGVKELVHDDRVKAVGSFSMTCGKLRKEGSKGVAIISNRAASVDEVPIVGEKRGEIWGLSNTTFSDPNRWPKISKGKQLLQELLKEAIESKSTQKELIASLFNLLDDNTLPVLGDDAPLVEYLNKLRQSIFVPAVGSTQHKKDMEESRAKGPKDWDPIPATNATADGSVVGAFDRGLYGTQRQTVILVDLEGNVTFVERALFDPNGNEIPRGEGDVEVTFKVEGWES